MKTGTDGSGKKNLSYITFLLAFYAFLTTSFTTNPENFMWKSHSSQNSVSEFDSSMISSLHTSNDISIVASTDEDEFFISTANRLQQNFFDSHSH